MAMAMLARRHEDELRPRAYAVNVKLQVKPVVPMFSAV
jgi:hypothetical protein